MIKFQPLFKPTIWGGKKIARWKQLSGTEHPAIGESLEISDLPGQETLTAEGTEKGLTLRDLIRRDGERFLGRHNFNRFGEKFPLLIKIIDADQDLSLQVHPNDEQARREGFPFGKNEMWYIVATDADAKIVNGFRQTLSPDAFREAIRTGTFEQYQSEFSTAAGDCYYIPAGRLHSICKGNLLIEIQQTSDLTYRVYDYNRTDADGSRRELHIEKALEALDFSVTTHCKSEYTPVLNRRIPLVRCPYFTTNAFRLTQEMTVDHSRLDSFVILIAAEGNAVLRDDNGQELPLQAGESLLLPATTRTLTVRPTSERFHYVETYIEDGVD